jgi:hypothetical protein
MTNTPTTMNPDAVLDALRRRGTKFVTVTFVKKDGSLRRINGHLRAARHIVGGARGEAHSEAMKARGQVPIYDLKNKGWRSFFVDSVVEIK